MKTPKDLFTDYHSHLSQIPTEVGASGVSLVLRYQKAVRRYLRKLLGNEHEADLVADQVVDKMLNGKFDSWQPGQGKFRHYLKQAVRNTALTHLDKKKRGPVSLAQDVASTDEDPAAAWDRAWSQTIRAKAWKALRRFQDQRQQSRNQHADGVNIYYTLLRLRQRYPQDGIPQLLARFNKRTQREMSAATFRQNLHRARQKFAELLLDEVRQSLDNPTEEQIHEELSELGLMRYLRGYLPGAAAE